MRETALIVVCDEGQNEYRCTFVSMNGQVAELGDMLARYFNTQEKADSLITGDYIESIKLDSEGKPVVKPLEHYVNPDEPWTSFHEAVRYNDPAGFYYLWDGESKMWMVQHLQSLASMI